MDLSSEGAYPGVADYETAAQKRVGIAYWRATVDDAYAAQSKARRAAENAAAMASLLERLSGDPLVDAARKADEDLADANSRYDEAVAKLALAQARPVPPVDPDNPLAGLGEFYPGVARYKTQTEKTRGVKNWDAARRADTVAARTAERRKQQVIDTVAGQSPAVFAERLANAALDHEIAKARARESAAKTDLARAREIPGKTTKKHGKNSKGGGVRRAVVTLPLRTWQTVDPAQARAAFLAH